MGCPHSHVVDSVVRCGDGACSQSVAVEISATNIEFGCYGRVVNETASGPPAFSAEQRRLIKETWAKMSPQSTAIGKQVQLLSLVTERNLQCVQKNISLRYIGSRKLKEFEGKFQPKYSGENTDSMHLKVSCIFVKCSLLTAMQSRRQ